MMFCNVSSKIYRSQTYSLLLLARFFDAFFAAGFSVVSPVASARTFGAVRFARGAAAAPPRFRPLLSASLAGLVSGFPLVAFASGFTSLLSETVT
jgi:hypothetical protein